MLDGLDPTRWQSRVEREEDDAAAFTDDLGDALGRVRREMWVIPRSWDATDTSLLLAALTALADGEAPPWRK